MFTLAIKLVLMLAVMFGGAGVTAAAAQSSLPNEALYPVKLLIEDVQSGLASTPDAQIDVQLEHAQQRVREMVQLTDRGMAVPFDVPVQLQTQLQAALQIAAQEDDQSMQAALNRIQLRTQDQLREMEQLHLKNAAQVLTQAREMAQLGQSDPQFFRERFGHGRPADAPPQPAMTPQVAPSYTPQGARASLTPQPSHTPQSSHTPQATCTPQGQSYSLGPQNTTQPATPVGQGDGHEYGPAPQSTPQGPGGSQTTPTSGGNGSGPGGSGSGNSGSGSGGSGSGSGSGGGSGSGSGRP